MSSLFLSLTVKTLKAEKETCTNQLTDISSDERLDLKYTANAKSDIENNYEMTKELIQNEMELIDDKTCPEYEDLLQELNELKDERDQKMKRIEEEESNKEKMRDDEKTVIETKLEAINADIETFKEGRDKAIEDEYNYAAG